MVRVVLLAFCLLVFFSPLHAAWIDPVYGFSLDFPKEWRTDENNSVQSRNLVVLSTDNAVAAGVISVNAGRPLTLEQWIEIIEPMFLDDILPGGKRKHIEARQQNGIQGMYAAYQGTHSSGKGQVKADARIFYLMRGNVGHIVWCVVPGNSLNIHLPQAEKVVASFTFTPTAKAKSQPSVSGLPTTAATQPGRPSLSQPAQSSSPFQARAGQWGYGSIPLPVELRNRYTRQGAGYEFRYPNGWTVTASDDHTVAIAPTGAMGADGTPVITIQNFAHTRYGGSYATLAAVVSGAREHLFKPGEVKLERDRPFQYPGAGSELKGVELIAAFNLNNKPMRQQIIILARRDEQGFHLWSYTAGKDNFNANKPIIDAILSSWKIYP